MCSAGPGEHLRIGGQHLPIRLNKKDFTYDVHLPVVWYTTSNDDMCVCDVYMVLMLMYAGRVSRSRTAPPPKT